MIEYWTCQACKRANASGRSRCKCGAAKTTYTTDGEKIIPKIDVRDERLKAWAAKQRKIQRDIKPGTEEQLFTSTMKRKEKADE